MKRNIILIIAGSDSSGGAGIQADIKTAHSLLTHPLIAVTAITAQDINSVRKIHELPINIIDDQLVSNFSSFNIEAIKIGMIYSEKILQHIKFFLEELRSNKKNIPVVLDPVFFASNGDKLFKNINLIDNLCKNLSGLIDIITPNLYEAESLSGLSINSYKNMEIAAEAISKKFSSSVLLKGGHLYKTISPDCLFLFNTKSIQWFKTKKIKIKGSFLHGTGCTLSTAIAAYLAKNNDISDAVLNSKIFIQKSIKLTSRIDLPTNSVIQWI